LMMRLTWRCAKKSQKAMSIDEKDFVSTIIILYFMSYGDSNDFERFIRSISE